MLEALGMHRQTTLAALSFGQGALGRTRAHASFPPRRVLQEQSCFPSRLGAAALSGRAVGSPWGDTGMPQQASADPAFCTFHAAVRIVLASLVDNFFPEQTSGGDLQGLPW